MRTITAFVASLTMIASVLPLEASAQYSVRAMVLAGGTATSRDSLLPMAPTFSGGAIVQFDVPERYRADISPYVGVFTTVMLVERAHEHEVGASGTGLHVLPLPAGGHEHPVSLAFLRVTVEGPPPFTRTIQGDVPS